MQQLVPLLLLAFAALGARAVDSWVVGQFVKETPNAIANQLGLWDAQGLNVTYQTVAGSAQAYQGLDAGTYNVLAASVDNTIGLRINKGQAVTVVGGGQVGAGLALWSTASITSPSQLKNKTIGVDALNSGLVYALQKVLLAYGLQPSIDYSYQALGGTQTRIAFLKNGSIDATLFTFPFTEIQQLNNTENLNLLAQVTDYVPEYQTTSYNVKSSVLQDNSSAVYQDLVKFLLVQLQARQILTLSIANTKARASVILAIEADFNVDSATATSLWQDSIAANGVLANPNLAITKTQLLASAYLRQQFGGFNGTANSLATDLSRLFVAGYLVDYGPRDAAANLLQQPGSNGLYQALLAQWH